MKFCERCGKNPLPMRTKNGRRVLDYLCRPCNRARQRRPNATRGLKFGVPRRLEAP